MVFILISKEEILKAKEKLGDKNADIIADVLHIENYDTRNKKGLCPFHNEDTPSFIFNPKSYGFHCFRGDTKIITKYGLHRIDSLLEQETEIINGNGEWEKVKFVNCGKQQIYKLTLARCGKTKTIYTTKEHNWIVQGYNKKIPTFKLKTGYKLERMWFKNKKSIKPTEEGMRHGFIFGDGTIGHINKDGNIHYYARICTENKLNFCKKIFDIYPNVSSDKDYFYGRIRYKSSIKMKEVPDIHKHSEEYLLGFLIGLFVADGNCSDETVIISSANLNDLKKIKDICTLIGIPTYAIGGQTRTPSSNTGIVKINQPHRMNTLRLVKGIIPKDFFFGEKSLNTTPVYKSYLGYKVVSVEETSEITDVFCCETSTGSFVIEDFILTGNCFGCSKNIDIIDAYMHKGKTYIESVEELFKEAKIQYVFGEKGVKTKREYRYPKPEPINDKTKVYEYLSKRKISKETIDKCDVREDKYGNIVFNYYDTNDVLTMVKYRPSHRIDKSKGEVKNWCQQGADTTPLLFNMNKINFEQPLLVTEGECLKGDSQVLTPNGWIRLDEYNNEKVLQINPDLTGTFVVPKAYVKHEYDGELYVDSKKNFTSETTANHNIVYIDYKGRLQKKKACEIKNLGVGYIPTVTEVNGNGIPLSNDELALYIAISADCTIDVKKTGHRYSRFSCKKERKYLRLKKILDSLNIEYFDNPNTSDGYKYIGFKTPDFVISKMFPMEWIGLATLNQRKFIIEEMVEWDGNRVKTRNQYEYASKEYNNALFMQTIAHTCGYMSTIIPRQNIHGKWFKVSVLLNKNHVAHQKPYKVEHFKGMVYCVSVDSGMILIRQNNHISITGNCDCLAAIESGYANTVSVPLGANNYGWIEENFDWLEQFSSIIICADNDEAGQKMQKECLFRLGSWRTKFIEIPKQHIDEETGEIKPMKDLNEVLFYEGKQAVMNLIYHAKDPGVPSVVDFSDIEDIDVDEIDGIKTGLAPLDKELMKLFYGTLTVITGTPGCVDKDTEFFNGKQWKRISDYSPDDKVLQYNKDGTATLVTPIQYHKYPCDKFYYIHTNHGIDQMISEEHNIVYVTSKGHLNKKSAKDFVNQHRNSSGGFSGKFIPTFDFSGSKKGINLSDDEIRLMCAIIADGTFTYKLSDKASTYDKVRFNLKKDRKKQRIEMLLNNANIPYEKKTYNSKIKGYDNYYFKAPLRTKKFPTEWYNCSKHQFEIIADEVLYWDGSLSESGRKRFFTTDKDNADFIQFVFTSLGYRTSIKSDNRAGTPINDKYRRKSNCYTLTISQQKNPLICLSNNNNKTPIYECSSEDGYKYCFTVPSGMFVMRRNDSIQITGNSGKSSFISQLVCQTADQDKGVWLFSRELPNWMTRSWINYVFAGSGNIKEYSKDDIPSYKVTPFAKQGIKEYYKEKITVYRDELSNKLDDLITSATDCVRKYGTKLVILDNLMCIDLNSNENDEKQKQTECINKLIAFATKYHVAVVLIAHPRKMEKNTEISLYDVSGTSNIANLAHRTLALKRIDEKSNSEFDVELTIIKDRLFGKLNKKIPFYYDVPSRRFYTNREEFTYNYKWDKNKQNTNIPYPQQQNSEIFGEIKNNSE